MKPCPFCGTSERDDHQEMKLPYWLQVNEIAGSLFNVECFGCGLETRYQGSEERALKLWNTRDAEPMAFRC